MPLTKKGRKLRFDNKIRYIPDKEWECPTENQARHVYKKVEIDKIINIETMKQEIEDDKMTRNRLNEEDKTETNHYQMAILNKVYKDEIKTEQMIHWSILSDLIKYIDRSSDIVPSLTVKPLDYRQHKRLYYSLKTDKYLTADVEFEGNKLKDEYFNKYENIYAEISQATGFDESTDLSKTYLGKTDMTRGMIIKAEEKFPIFIQGYVNGKLLDNTECSILIDRGAKKSYMSKSYYMQCKHFMHYQSLLHQGVQVGNGQCAAVVFVIPVIIDVYGHTFEVFTLVSEIHDNVDFMLGMKNVFELEGVIDTQDSSFKFLNRSIPFFSKEQVI